MNCHGGCARNARLKQAIDRVPKLKVIDPKADPRLMGAPGTPARRRCHTEYGPAYPFPPA